MHMIVFAINLLKSLKWTSHPLVDLGNKCFFPHLFHEIENIMCDGQSRLLREHCLLILLRDEGKVEIKDL